ncbi:hypothetical protein HZ326_0601 [Fusarium oxysporum f. sp. albedinis]|nr:hypothetical protein HZ326_0601 [Fusarium oxysporum f. sp. albedinis]
MSIITKPHTLRTLALALQWGLWTFLALLGSTISTVLSDKHTDSTSTLSPNPTSHCHHSRHPCANFKPAAIGIAALTHNIKPPLYT